MAEHGRIQNDEIKKKKSIRLHFEEVERKTGAEGLSFVDDVVRVATGKDAEEVTAKFKSRRRMGTSQRGQLRRRQDGGGPLSEGPEGDSS